MVKTIYTIAGQESSVFTGSSAAENAASSLNTIFIPWSWPSLAESRTSVSTSQTLLQLGSASWRPGRWSEFQEAKPCVFHDEQAWMYCSSLLRILGLVCRSLSSTWQLQWDPPYGWVVFYVGFFLVCNNQTLFPKPPWDSVNQSMQSKQIKPKKKKKKTHYFCLKMIKSLPTVET